MEAQHVKPNITYIKNRRIPIAPPGDTAAGDCVALSSRGERFNCCQLIIGMNPEEGVDRWYCSHARQEHGAKMRILHADGFDLK